MIGGSPPPVRRCIRKRAVATAVAATVTPDESRPSRGGGAAPNVRRKGSYVFWAPPRTISSRGTCRDCSASPRGSFTKPPHPNLPTSLRRGRRRRPSRGGSSGRVGQTLGGGVLRGLRRRGTGDPRLVPQAEQKRASSPLTWPQLGQSPAGCGGTTTGAGGAGATGEAGALASQTRQCTNPETPIKIASAKAIHMKTPP